MCLASYHMADLHEMVINNTRKMISWPTIGFQQYRIVEELSSARHPRGRKVDIATKVVIYGWPE